MQVLQEHGFRHVAELSRRLDTYNEYQSPNCIQTKVPSFDALRTTIREFAQRAMEADAGKLVCRFADDQGSVIMIVRTCLLDGYRPRPEEWNLEMPSVTAEDEMQVDGPATYSMHMVKNAAGSVFCAGALKLKSWDEGSSRFENMALFQRVVEPIFF